MGGRGARPSAGRRRVLLGATLAGFLAWIGLVWLPWPRGLDEGPPPRTALMEQRLSEARQAGEELDLQWTWVPFDRISPHLVRAVLLAEDQRFREHGGIDWRALAEEVEWSGGETFSWRSLADWGAMVQAVRHGWEHREAIRGRSTITQQLAKNLWFGTERSLVRKGREMVAARRLERALSKDRILELYLNVAEWGPGIFGAEVAARHYFGRAAADLTAEEAAALAATLPHPLTSNPFHAPAQMRWRQSLILERMRSPAAPF